MTRREAYVSLGQNGGNDDLVVFDGGHEDVVPLEHVVGAGGILSVIVRLGLGGLLLNPQILILEGTHDAVGLLGQLQGILAGLGGTLQLGEFLFELLELVVDLLGVSRVFLGEVRAGLVKLARLLLQGNNLSLNVSVLEEKEREKFRMVSKGGEVWIFLRLGLKIGIRNKIFFNLNFILKSNFRRTKVCLVFIVSRCY